VVRRRVDAPERAVERERRGAGRPLRALREDDLEGIPCPDVPLRPAHALLVRLARGEARRRPGLAARRRLRGRLCFQPGLDLRRIPCQHLRHAGRVVEADERRGDDEAALRQVRAGCGKGHRGLQHGHVVVAEVADDRPSRRHLPLGLGERHQAAAGAHEAVAAQPPLLDGLEQESGARARPQAQVGAERGDEVGVDVRGSGHGIRKDPPAGSTSGAGCEDASWLAGDAPAPLAAPGPPGAEGRSHLSGA
jgi:hypothetical protein